MPDIKIKPGTLAFKNNNPGNLKFANQPGAVVGEIGFASFESPLAGYQALLRQIALDARRGHSLSSFLNKYAPPSENKTADYLDFMKARLDAKDTDMLADLSHDEVAKAIAWMESSTEITETEMEQLEKMQLLAGDVR